MHSAEAFLKRLHNELTDFAEGQSLPIASGLLLYTGHIRRKCTGSFPKDIGKSLQQAFPAFGKKMKGYFTREAIVVATESRTSSPVRIPRHDDTLAHPQLNNLFPCGEGAGYAGGIMSAAMDGERVAEKIAEIFSPKSMIHVNA